MQDAVDTAAVAPGVGTFSERVQPYGCRGVPDGQHIGRCYVVINRLTAPGEAPTCSNCGLRGVSFHGVCPFCGEGR